MIFYASLINALGAMGLFFVFVFIFVMLNIFI